MKKDDSKKEDIQPDSILEKANITNKDDFLMRKKVSILLGEIREVREAQKRLAKECQENETQLNSLRELIEVYRAKIKYLEKENKNLKEQKKVYNALEEEVIQEDKVTES